MESYDVVVVGAGLAGLQVTRLLARGGARVLLADRKNSLEDSVHTTGIFVRRMLEECIDARAVWSPATRYAGLEVDDDSPDTSVVMLERAGVTRRVKARFVVGADGARSRVARDLGL